MLTQIQLRQGNASEWTSENPTLASGEGGYELDTGLFKIGDGTTSWDSLNYLNNNWVEVAASGTYNVGRGEYIIINTAATVNLPSSPKINDYIKFAIGGDVTLNNATVSGSGQKITGSTDNFVVDINFGFGFVYTGVDYGWSLTT